MDSLSDIEHKILGYVVTGLAPQGGLQPGIEISSYDEMTQLSAVSFRSMEKQADVQKKELTRVLNSLQNRHLIDMIAAPNGFDSPAYVPTRSGMNMWYEL